MNLYHITKGKYINSILAEGLKINSGNIGFCKKDAHKRYKKIYGMQPIFLTNDVEYISKAMLTNDWINKNKVIVLKVNVELNEINSSEGWFVDTPNGIESKEFRYFLNIEPHQIKVIKTEFKTFF